VVLIVHSFLTNRRRPMTVPKIPCLALDEIMHVLSARPAPGLDLLRMAVVCARLFFKRYIMNHANGVDSDAILL